MTPRSSPRFVIFLATTLALLGAAAPVVAQTPVAGPLPPLLSAEQRALYTRAFEALDAGHLADAKRIAAEGQDKVATKLFRWIELQQPRSGPVFEDIAGFIDANPDWPNQDTLARRAEEALIERTDDSVVLAWFALRGPYTVDGAMRYIEALMRAKERNKALKLIHDTWGSGSFGGTQEKTFLKRYGSYLTRDEHVKRLDRLLWDGRREEAKRMFAHVDADQRALADARVKLATMSTGVDGALRKVPDHMANDPGLVFERLRWRRKKGQEQAALDMLRQAPPDAVRPEIWWQERAIMARRAITAGRMSEAYDIAKNHGMLTGGGLTEAEFLAGWVALRFLKKPDTALGHFMRLYEIARFPVTQARGAYWAGRAAEAAGNKAAAAEWYTRAAKHATTYYGQVASSALDPQLRVPFPLMPQPSADDRRAFEQGEITRAARLLQETGQLKRVKPFILRLAFNAKTPEQHVLASELAARMERPDLAVSAAKRSAQIAGVAIPDYGWPTVRLPPASEPPERALIFATIRQESAFEVDAVSRAGARGLMQLILPTAKAVARQLGLPTDRLEHRLLVEPDLNLRLGHKYLASLIDDYDGSYVMALAGYNAGPGRVRQWVRDNGDPRQSSIDVIDWIELIPIEETRNYVHRVLENLQVYRQRLGTTQVASIDQDLRRRRAQASVPESNGAPVSLQ